MPAIRMFDGMTCAWCRNAEQGRQPIWQFERQPSAQQHACLGWPGVSVRQPHDCIPLKESVKATIDGEMFVTWQSGTVHENK